MARAARSVPWTWKGTASHIRLIVLEKGDTKGVGGRPSAARRVGDGTARFGAGPGAIIGSATAPLGMLCARVVSIPQKCGLSSAICYRGFHVSVSSDAYRRYGDKNFSLNASLVSFAAARFLRAHGPAFPQANVPREDTARPGMPRRTAPPVTRICNLKSGNRSDGIPCPRVMRRSVAPEWGRPDRSPG